MLGKSRNTHKVTTTGVVLDFQLHILSFTVQHAPHPVVLVDELEKTHENVLNILFQLIEDIMFTDRKVKLSCLSLYPSYDMLILVVGTYCK